MTRARGIIWTRVALIVAAVGFIELLCRLDVIKPLTMIAPSQMALELARMMASGELTTPAARTFMEVGVAFAFSGGWRGVGGTGSRAAAPAPCTRSPIGELVRGAVFRVLSIAGGDIRFERTAIDRHRRDICRARDDAEHSRRSRPGAARDAKGGPSASAVLGAGSASHHVAERRAAFVHGAEARLAYSFIGIIAGEFILSGGGLGYGIAYAYESFENRTMYALMLFVLLIATGVNGALHMWDGRLARRRGRT